MPGGKGNLRPEDNPKPFQPGNNANPRGAPLSIRKQIRQILESDGKLTIKKEHVIDIRDDGSVVILMPKRDMIAMKLLQWAMSNKHQASTKAIQMIMEHLEGKPAQSINLSSDEPINQIQLTDEQFEKAMETLIPKETKKKISNK